MKTNLSAGVLCLASIAVTGAIFLLPPMGRAEVQAETGALQSGHEIYLAACANCHGADGKGVSQSLLGYDEPLPDFSDCDFASREPDADWITVAHLGGPVRVFSEMMPAFGDVLTDEQIEKAMRHIRTFCTDSAWPRGELNLPRPLVTEKAFPEDEAVFTLAVDEDGKSIEAKVVYEQRFGARNQVEIAFPFGWSETTVPSDAGTNKDWTSSVGDIALAAKRAFYHNAEHGSIISGTAEFILPTGDEAAGFGKGTLVFEPFVTYGQILPAEFFLHSQLGFELPADSDKAEKEAFFRFALGRGFSWGRWGRSWTPMVELLGARELVSGETTNWDVVPEIQVTLSKRQHVMFNIGVRTPVNNTSDRDTQVIAYLLWDWFDGSLFEGW
jgi:mono/diheme cytochrome c family protein